MRRLLSHAVRVDVKDHDGREPLMWAASAGSTDAIVTLVNSGAGVAARDKGFFFYSSSTNEQRAEGCLPSCHFFQHFFQHFF